MTPNRNQLKRYYGPGVWEDMDGGLHFSLPDILAHLKLPDTPKNRAQFTEVLREMMAKVNPQAKIIERETEND